MARPASTYTQPSGARRLTSPTAAPVTTSLCATAFALQAEDGIRDLTVTGVQTCALPICRRQLGPVGELVGADRLDAGRDPAVADLRGAEDQPFPGGGPGPDGRLPHRPGEDALPEDLVDEGMRHETPGGPDGQRVVGVVEPEPGPAVVVDERPHRRPPALRGQLPAQVGFRRLAPP